MIAYTPYWLIPLKYWSSIQTMPPVLLFTWCVSPPNTSKGVVRCSLSLPTRYSSSTRLTRCALEAAPGFNVEVGMREFEILAMEVAAGTNMHVKTIKALFPVGDTRTVRDVPVPMRLRLVQCRSTTLRVLAV